jgi:hypothetical protein
MSDRDELISLSKAVLKYDKEIKNCANDPNKMSSHCTAEGEDLDYLYLDLLTKAKAALETRSQ